MTGHPDNVDCIILGGGPAGVCAALRLLQLGRRVALAERAPFPRNQIGESLSPGIQNLFAYLGAAGVLNQAVYARNLPASIVWETPHAIRRETGNTIVNRAALDSGLLALAVRQGLQLFQPAACVSARFTGGEWQVQLAGPAGTSCLTAAFVLDATGRSGTGKNDRIITAPPNVALWQEIPAAGMPAETLVEALPEGWVWGAPVTGGQFRVMAFTDPGRLKGRLPAAVMQAFYRESRLFGAAATLAAALKTKTCLVQHYSHAAPWQNNRLRLGECAFSLYSLSSSGVEKAMRFSLQAAIAVNTVLQTGDQALAQTYFEDQLIASVVNHTRWTTAYYGRAWPGTEAAFWKTRTDYRLPDGEPRNVYHGKLLQAFKEPADAPAPEGSYLTVPDALHLLWNAPVTVSPAARYVPATCVTGDILETKQAVSHPGLPGATAYIGGTDLIPLLAQVKQAGTFGELIRTWSGTLSFKQAAGIAVRLWSTGVLCLPV